MTFEMKMAIACIRRE